MKSNLPLIQHRIKVGPSKPTARHGGAKARDWSHNARNERLYTSPAHTVDLVEYLAQDVLNHVTQ